MPPGGPVWTLTCPSLLSGEGGQPSARVGPAGPVRLGQSRPFHRKLCLVLLCLCEKTAGRPWSPIVLLWHGHTWTAQSQRGALRTDVFARRPDATALWRQQERRRLQHACGPQRGSRTHVKASRISRKPVVLAHGALDPSGTLWASEQSSGSRQDWTLRLSVALFRAESVKFHKRQQMP